MFVFSLGVRITTGFPPGVPRRTRRRRTGLGVREPTVAFTIAAVIGAVGTGDFLLFGQEFDAYA